MSQIEMPAVALSIVITGDRRARRCTPWRSPGSRLRPTSSRPRSACRDRRARTPPRRWRRSRGRMNVPITESVSGTHGIAQLVITIPGTLTSRRPLGGTSWLSTTVPRYLPQCRLATGGSGSCSEPQVNCRGGRASPSSCGVVAGVGHGSSVRVGQLAGDAGSEDVMLAPRGGGTAGPPGTDRQRGPGPGSAGRRRAGPGAPGGRARRLSARSGTPGSCWPRPKLAGSGAVAADQPVALQREALLVGTRA